MSAEFSFQLKPLWKKLFPQSWIFLCLLALVMAIPRFWFMLKGDYNSIILIFIFMWLVPFLLLTKAGRNQMGMTKPKSINWLGGGFLLGIAGAITLYFIGIILFGDTIDHWYNSVMKSFDKGTMIQDVRPNYLLFLLISLPTMIFSPIGEEFFFRGMMQEALAEKWGATISTFVEAAFFGITHLAHHGLMATAFGYRLLPSAFPWVLLMMTVSILFSFVRTQSGSIWGAVLCHAGFNLGMMWCIFYLMN